MTSVLTFESFVDVRVEPHVNDDVWATVWHLVWRNVRHRTVSLCQPSNVTFTIRRTS